MTIAAHISILDHTTQFSEKFNYQCLLILANKYPEDHFIFIFDKHVPVTFLQKNITPVFLGPKIKNQLILHYWYNFKLPQLLKKYHATAFIAQPGVCSLRKNITQYLVVEDLSFLYKNNFYGKYESRYLKKYTPVFVKKATGIAVVTGFLENELKEKFPDTKGKTKVVGFGIDKHPILITSVPDKNTDDGKLFFTYPVTEASLANVTSILKAFSIFKKRLKTDMQLVLLFIDLGKEKLVKEFSSYKYRKEVKILAPENNEETIAIIAASYGVVYLSHIKSIEHWGLYALLNNVPLITLDNSFSKSIYDDAALYTNADDKAIAENMMLLYKDEYLCKDLIIKGSKVLQNHQWEKTADLLWEMISK